jgi:hypothetical protein
MLNQRQIKNFTVDTLLQLNAINGRASELCYCVETDTEYKYEANGALYTVDDKAVVATLNGGNTRWIGVSGKYRANRQYIGTSYIIPTEDNEIVSKKYVDDNAGGGGSAAPYLLLDNLYENGYFLDNLDNVTDEGGTGAYSRASNIDFKSGYCLNVNITDTQSKVVYVRFNVPENKMYRFKFKGNITVSGSPDVYIDLVNTTSFNIIDSYTTLNTTTQEISNTYNISESGDYAFTIEVIGNTLGDSVDLNVGDFEFYEDDSLALIDRLSKQYYQEGHGFDNSFIYHDGTTWIKAIATSDSTIATHFAIASNVDYFIAIPIGEVDFTGMTDDQDNVLIEGSLYYLSQTVEGKVAVKPTSGIVQPVFKVNNTTATVLIGQKEVDAVSGSSEVVYKEITQATHGFDNSFIYNNGTTWLKAQADDEATTATHFAVRVDDNIFNAVVIGEVDVTGLLDDDGQALVNNTFYFLSQTVAGKIATTEPTTGIKQVIMKTNTTNNATISIEIPFDLAEPSNLAYTDQENTFTEAQIIPAIKPSADSTTAFQVFKADGTTDILTIDTTNSEMELSGNLSVGVSSAFGKTHIQHDNDTVEGQTSSEFRDLGIVIQNSNAGFTAIRTEHTTGAPYDGDIVFYNQVYSGTEYVWKEGMRLRSDKKLIIGTTYAAPTLDNEVATKKYVDDNSGGGGVSYSSREVSTTTTTTTTDDLVFANGNFTITLHAASTFIKPVTIKNISTGIITVDGNDSETIDGNLTITLNQYDSATLMSNGTNVYII